MIRSEAAMPEGHHWKPITDLPDDWQGLADAELPPLACVWADQRGRLAESGEVERFNERLRRQWAIETGIIERLYDIDRGVTQLLVEHGLRESLISHSDTDRPPEEVVAIIRDQHEAVEGLFDFVASRRELSTSYIKELHQLLTRHQPTTSGRDGLGRTVATSLRRGAWKQWPNNPTREDGSIFEYCPPEQVDSEMDRLIEMHLRHVAGNVPPEVEAAWLHHRFTQIHPFQDGNGRIARCLATLVFLRAGWFPLVVTRDDRAEYIGTLESADDGDMGNIVGLFARIEREAFLRALDLSEEVKAPVGVWDVIASAQERLVRRHTEQAELMAHPVFALVRPLAKEALRKLKEVAEGVQHSVHAVDPTFRAEADAGENDGMLASRFAQPVVSAASSLGYIANVDAYHSWCELDILAGMMADIVVSFHALGEEFQGIVAAIVVAIRWDSKPSEWRVRDWALASPRVFQVNYLDDPAAASSRFETWLSESLVIALDQWRRWL